MIVASVRSLKMHNGFAKDDVDKQSPAAVAHGGENLALHIANLRKFGVPVVVAINHFASDSEAEIAEIARIAEAQGCKAISCTDWADGGAGTEDLAREVATLCDEGTAAFKPLYPDDIGLWKKIETVAKEIYRAGAVTADAAVRQRLDEYEKSGFGHFPVCMAKTQYSFSTDPKVKGAPVGHTVNIREVRLSAGAGFVVALAGDILTMPGLPRIPAAHAIRLNDAGQIEGLF